MISGVFHVLSAFDAGRIPYPEPEWLIRRMLDLRWDEAVLDVSTHDLYCHLWSTAVFQTCVREQYTGGYLRDTLNDPALFRLQSHAAGGTKK